MPTAGVSLMSPASLFATVARRSTRHASSTVASLTDPANEQKLHVLLVEDDHATLVFVKALLKSCGHQGTRPLASSAPPARATGADPFREFGRVLRVEMRERPRIFVARATARRTHAEADRVPSDRFPP